MPDLRQQPDDSPLFGTSHAAGQKAALKAGSWRARILKRLEERPSALWEVAEHYQTPDHCISGRFTELVRDGFIEPTGERRRKPSTDCDAEVYRLRRSEPGSPAFTVDSAILELYPLTVTIDGDLYDRQELLSHEGYPAVPYSRRADNGGLRLSVRVEIIESPCCGRPLAQLAGDPRRFRCMGKDCGRLWRARAVNEPGKASLLALVLEEMS
jgi:hypothetical protein